MITEGTVQYYENLLENIAKKMEAARGTDKYNKWGEYYDDTFFHLQCVKAGVISE